MRKIFDKIKDINQILLFAIGIAMLVMIAIELSRDLFKEKFEPPKVEITDSSKPNEKKVKIGYKIEFEAKIKDIYIFNLRSGVIDRSATHSLEATYAAKDSYGLSDIWVPTDHGIVNMMFVNADGKRRMLLEKDALIAKFTYNRSEENPTNKKIDKNIYQIVSDSNHDGFLDIKDQQDLYVSSYNGENLTLVVQNIKDYEIIEDNLLLIHQFGENGKYFTYNVKDGSLTELNTQISTK